MFWYFMPYGLEEVYQHFSELAASIIRTGSDISQTSTKPYS
jgi:hypothetical protein